MAGRGRRLDAIATCVFLPLAYGCPLPTMPLFLRRLALPPPALLLRGAAGGAELRSLGYSLLQLSVVDDELLLLLEEGSIDLVHVEHGDELSFLHAGDNGQPPETALTQLGLWELEVRAGSLPLAGSPQWPRPQRAPPLPGRSFALDPSVRLVSSATTVGPT